MITFANNLVTSESMIPYVVRFALIFGCLALSSVHWSVCVLVELTWFDLVWLT